MNTRQIYGALTVSCALALVACGGGGGSSGSDATQPVTPALDRINTSNYTQAIGAVATQMARGAEIVQLAVTVLQPGIRGVVQTDFACAQGGKLTLQPDGSSRVFTAQDCRVGNLLLVSGTLTESPLTGSLSETQVALKGLNYRNVVLDAAVNTVNNMVWLTVDGQGKLVRADASVDMNRKGALESYSVSFNWAADYPGWFVAATTVNFPYRLNAQENTTTKGVKLWSREDGSQIVYTPSADGKTYAIEMTNKTQTLSKTVSKAEFDSWVKAAGG